MAVGAFGETDQATADVLRYRAFKKLAGGAATRVGHVFSLDINDLPDYDATLPRIRPFWLVPQNSVLPNARRC
jgi:hypothetical protein